MAVAMQCPHCGFRLKIDDDFDAHGLSCPMCLGTLAAGPTAGPQRGPRPQRPHTADDDYRRDRKGMGCGMMGLATLGLIGALITSSGAGLFGPGALATLALIAVGVLTCFHDQAWARVTRKALTVILAIGGALVLIPLAFVVFAFVACLAGGFRMH